MFDLAFLVLLTKQVTKLPWVFLSLRESLRSYLLSAQTKTPRETPVLMSATGTCLFPLKTFIARYYQKALLAGRRLKLYF